MLRFYARHRPDIPDAKLLADLYEETGDQFYYAALAHLILDKLEKQLWAEKYECPAPIQSLVKKRIRRKNIPKIPQSQALGLVLRVVIAALKNERTIVVMSLPPSNSRFGDSRASIR